MGSPTRNLTPEERTDERKLLQELVNRSFERFKNIVASGRPKLKANEAAFDKATTGQLFTSEQALEIGLVDQIGFVDEAIGRAAALAKLDVNSLRCVKYVEPPNTLSMLLGAEASLAPAGRADLAALLELTAPRAYYLCTWLPSILANSR